MIRISLNEEEQSALKRLRLHKTSSIGERAHYVLLSNDGKSVPEIAQYLSRNGHTIRLWLERYMTDGIKGLKTRKNPGRPARKAPILDLHLQELLNKSPQDYGFIAVKKSSKYRQKPIKQNYFWRIKHSDKSILLEAS